jgi:hypothetical protein
MENIHTLLGTAAWQRLSHVFLVFHANSARAKRLVLAASIGDLWVQLLKPSCCHDPLSHKQLVAKLQLKACGFAPCFP